MPNPGGGNQFGNYQIQAPYGDVKKQTELIREAPMSGAPTSGRALGAARSAQKQAIRGQQQPQAAPVGPPPGPQAAPVSPQAFTLAAWQQISQIPGASPLVQEYAARA